jgi:HlyD family secretion protein
MTPSFPILPRLASHLPAAGFHRATLRCPPRMPHTSGPRLQTVLGSLCACLAIIGHLGCQQPNPWQFGGYVEAEKIEVGSRVGGRVAKVYVEEGDEVSAGELLVEFEREHLEAQLEEARQRASRLETAWKKAVSGPRPQEIERVRQELAAAEARERQAQDQYRRAVETGKGAVTQERIVELKALKEVAESQRRALEQELSLLEEGTRAEDRIIAQREMEEAQARVRVLQDQLNESRVTSPAHAVVEVCDLQVGDLVAAGLPVATLVRTDQIWVRCFVPATQISHIAPGMKVRVAVDARPNEYFEGVVLRINRVAEYTPRNVQTFEQRAEQVFGVKVRVRDPRGVLRPGMAAVVSIPAPATATRQGGS